MKRLIAFFLGGLSATLVVVAIGMGVVGIWTGDSRWGYTSLLLGGTGFLVGFATATYPDW